jgi:hypothetical protein
VSGVLTLGALALIVGASHTRDRLALTRLPSPELQRYERVSLELTAGLGLTALLLSIGALFGLFVPAMVLIAIAALLGVLSERFLAACRRQGITHLFAALDGNSSLSPHLRMVYQNSASRLGGARFFREPPSEATAIFAIVP